MENTLDRQTLIETPRLAEEKAIFSESFGQIYYGVNLADTLPYMESRKSIRKFRGAYARTRPLLTWALFLCLILLWGFTSLTFKSNALQIVLEWKFDTFFGATTQLLGFAGITALIWVLNFILMFYYVRYQVEHQNKAALYVTELAIFVMLGVILLRFIGGEAHQGSQNFQSLVQGVYVLVMVAIVLLRFYQVHLLPVWQEKNWPLTIPITRELPNETVAPQLLNEYSGRCLNPLRWCAYEYVGQIKKFLPRFLANRYKIAYVGEVDTDGRPHGFGEWWDSHYHGEHLVGLWQKGKPVGPFKSREKGSSSGFKNFRIGYFMNRGDPLDKRLCFPQFAPDDTMLYGMLSIECSVSGVFFKGYPRITFLDGPIIWEPNFRFANLNSSFHFTPPGPSTTTTQKKGQHNNNNNNNNGNGNERKIEIKSTGLEVGGGLAEMGGNEGVGFDVTRRVSESNRSWMIQRLERSPSLLRDAREQLRQDTVVVSADPNRGLVVSGYEHVDRDDRAMPDIVNIQFSKGALSSVQGDWKSTCLEVAGWEPKTKYGKYEALVFIHGFNAAVSDASRIFGQFLALSNLPSYIKPIIFSWPGGSEFSYREARSMGAESEQTAEAFIELFHFLAVDGFSRIHIMAHSMGVRILTTALNEIEKIIPGRESKPDMLPMKIATITLLSPDAELEPFRAHQGHRLRALCPVVTMYGDRTDQALYYAEVANWLIDFVEERKRKRLLSRNNVDTSSTANVAQDSASTTENQFFFSVFGSSNKFEFVRQKARKMFKGWTRGFRLKNLGRITDQVTDPVTGEPLDIDVIDTSYMESNVHGWRHNYFNLNRELVEDIRDLIVTQRRAHQRISRLEWLGGNVFGFLVAPTYVVNP